MGSQFMPTGGVSPEAMQSALRSFWYTAASVATHHARERGLQWPQDLSFATADSIAEAIEAIDLAPAWDDTPPQALYVLFIELLWITFQYGGDIPENRRTISQEQLGAFFAATEAPAGSRSERALDDIETVKGSIESILDRLPNAIRKLFDALMELLKLSRGLA